jgi:hypothetical protein
MPDTATVRPTPAAAALAIARAAVPAGHLSDDYRGDAFVTETNSALWALNREREWIIARCVAHRHPAAAVEDGEARCWCGARRGQLSPSPSTGIDVEITLPGLLLEQLRGRGAVRHLLWEIEQHGDGCALILRPLETVR